MKSVILATLTIYSTSSQESLQLLFNSFPTTKDIQDQLGEAKYQGLVDSCEVPEVSAYVEDFEATSDGSISFECLDADDKFVGSILIERKEVNSGSAVPATIE